jgi:hypothetical protein
MIVHLLLQRCSFIQHQLVNKSVVYYPILPSITASSGSGSPVLFAASFAVEQLSLARSFQSPSHPYW